MIRFSRQSREALILGGKSNTQTWYGSSLLNPSVVEFDEKVLLYFRGHVGTDNNNHAVGHWRLDVKEFEVSLPN